MPFKYNASCRHKLAKSKHRVTNWAEYTEILHRRMAVANPGAETAPPARDLDVLAIKAHGRNRYSCLSSICTGAPIIMLASMQQVPIPPHEAPIAALNVSFGTATTTLIVMYDSGTRNVVRIYKFYTIGDLINMPGVANEMSRVFGWGVRPVNAASEPGKNLKTFRSRKTTLTPDRQRTFLKRNYPDVSAKDIAKLGHHLPNRKLYRLARLAKNLVKLGLNQKHLNSAGSDASNYIGSINLTKLSELSELFPRKQFPNVGINGLAVCLLNNPNLNSKILSDLCKIFPTKEPEELSHLANDDFKKDIDAAIKEKVTFLNANVDPFDVLWVFDSIPEVGPKKVAELNKQYPDIKIVDVVRVYQVLPGRDISAIIKKAAKLEDQNVARETALNAVVLGEIFPEKTSSDLIKLSGDLTPERLKNIAQLKKIFPEKKPSDLIKQSRDITPDLSVDITPERLEHIVQLKEIFPEGTPYDLINKSRDITPERLKNIVQLKEIFPEGTPYDLINENRDITPERLKNIVQLKKIFPEGTPSYLINESRDLTPERLKNIAQLKKLLPEGYFRTLVGASRDMTAKQMVLIQQLKKTFPKECSYDLIKQSGDLTPKQLKNIAQLKKLRPEGTLTDLIKESEDLTSEQLKHIAQLKELFPEGNPYILINKSRDLTPERLKHIAQLKEIFPEGNPYILINKSEDLTSEQLKHIAQLKELFPEGNPYILINKSRDLTPERLKHIAQLKKLFPNVEDEVSGPLNFYDDLSYEMNAKRLRTIAYLKKRFPDYDNATLMNLSQKNQRLNHFLAMLNTVNTGNLVRWMRRKRNSDTVQPATAGPLPNAYRNAGGYENSHWLMRILRRVSASPVAAVRRHL